DCQHARLGAEHCPVVLRRSKHHLGRLDVRACPLAAWPAVRPGAGPAPRGCDTSSIPSIAIKILEVLRDGATAQYGSDAIAGVLNYALRDDAGFEVLARYGQYKEDSDGESQQIAANFGMKFGDQAFVN